MLICPKKCDWKITKAKRWETPRTTGGMPSAAMAAVGVINTAGTATVAISRGDAPMMLPLGQGTCEIKVTNNDRS